ncbi:hypothetical protein WH50_08240 [Pokkaliibacter plantistimulans]|uniref:Lipopolysaccharide export system protein LptA n=1 Tax=Pokkaliibacter plantistimulans TaxID=1635171 RepID=A0ABX5LZS1_9GAMM|nr:lipopolysaccharide transport periplasmic protein LptA [Pokkaliibacter plantistimulans]PXF31727.1 hypothetical protein WH50_08240 [Pokkaliibacter plantistimulans]
MKKLVKLAFGAAILLPTLAMALPEDREKPVHIVSDQAVLDDAKGTVTYTGNVKLTQGTLEINADKVVLHVVNNELTKAFAYGKPAHYQQLPSPNQPLTHAYGLTLEYDLTAETVTAIEQAKLTQNQDTFTGERITYDITKRTVNAFSAQGSSGKRVEMILQPKKKATP